MPRGQQAGRCRQQGAWVRGGVSPQGHTSLGNAFAAAAPGLLASPTPHLLYLQGQLELRVAHLEVNPLDLDQKQIPFFLGKKKGGGEAGMDLRDS